MCTSFAMKSHFFVRCEVEGFPCLQPGGVHAVKGVRYTAGCMLPPLRQLRIQELRLGITRYCWHARVTAGRSCTAGSVWVGGGGGLLNAQMQGVTLGLGSEGCW
jgi:hypothetical protein